MSDERAHIEIKNSTGEIKLDNVVETDPHEVRMGNIISALYSITGPAAGMPVNVDEWTEQDIEYVQALATMLSQWAETAQGVHDRG